MEKKSEEINVIRKVAKDLIATKFLTQKEIKKIYKKFYAVMRKHGIKQGTKSTCGEGVTVANPEWTICKELFLSGTQQQLDIEDLFGNVPKDIYYY